MAILLGLVVERYFLFNKVWRVITLRLNNSEVEKAIERSRASVEHEGLEPSKESDEICRRLLKGELSSEEANKEILKIHGIEKAR